MNNKPYSQAADNKSGLQKYGKWIITVGVFGVLAMILVITILAGLVYIRGEAASQGEIFFRSPAEGEQVTTGQSIQVRILARDEQKIVRLEFWADGTLIESQTSNIPGGINPFPLLTTWQPNQGAHTLIARAFNSKDQTSQAIVHVEATVAADRDADGVLDPVDACPDQAGSPTSRGCPDRDLDGIADSTDACPDVAGLPDSGCPAPSEGDRDGDGVLDSEDACPDEPGAAVSGGCHDTDGDGISDTTDACPEEAGSGDGCPVSGDADGDTVPDATDACPHVWGLPEHAGCPDSDGDGVIDSEDACPADPGEIEGCPEAGGEAPSGGGEDGSDGEGVDGEEDGPFGDMGSDEAVDLVRLEALEFSVSQDYDEIYCYAGLVGEGMEQYGPFAPLGLNHWDIVEYLGGVNSRTFGLTLGDPLRLHVECVGNRGDTDSFILGSFSRTYDSSQWDGHVINEASGASGDPGHSFNVKFRLCHRTCDDATFPPPALHRALVGPFHIDSLIWHWDGNTDDINGFRLYINGHLREIVHNPHATRIRLHDYLPDCGEHNIYTISAYHFGAGGFRETPQSNGVAIDGEACPRSYKVTFDGLQVSGLHYGSGGSGPAFGDFWASGSDLQRLEFDGGSCFWIIGCRGYEIEEATTPIMNIFNAINLYRLTCVGLGCMGVNAPDRDYVIVEMNEGENLSFGGDIWYEQEHGSDIRLFHDQYTLAVDESMPTHHILEDTNSHGTFQVRVLIEEVEE